jgi:hypothetical protein
MRGGDASKLCPGIQLVQVYMLDGLLNASYPFFVATYMLQVPTAYGKAEVYVYRKAGEEVVKVLSKVFE